MEKYVLAIFSFTVIVAFAGMLVNDFSSNEFEDGTEITGNAVRQAGASVFIGQFPAKKSIAQPVKKTPVQPVKKAATGLIINDGMPYTDMTATAGLGTTMAGMVNINGIPVSKNTLQEKCIIFGSDGKLHTLNKQQVQIKDSELRRKPIKLTFGTQKKC